MVPTMQVVAASRLADRMPVEVRAIGQRRELLSSARCAASSRAFGNHKGHSAAYNARLCPVEDRLAAPQAAQPASTEPESAQCASTEPQCASTEPESMCFDRDRLAAPQAAQPASTEPESTAPVTVDEARAHTHMQSTHTHTCTPHSAPAPCNSSPAPRRRRARTLDPKGQVAPAPRRALREGAGRLAA